MESGATVKRNQSRASRAFRFPFPRSPNSSGSSASSTKRLTASPPPKPTPKRTSKTPAPSSKATSNPSSPSAARGGWRRRLENLSNDQRRQRKHYPTERIRRDGIPVVNTGQTFDARWYLSQTIYELHSTKDATNPRRRANSAGGDV